MGQPKLLLPWRGKTVIEHVLAAWRASRVAKTIVVTHPDDAALRQLCIAPDVAVLVANPPPADMKASVAVALDHIASSFSPRPGDVWLLAPADLPLLSNQVIDELLAAHDPLSPVLLRPELANGRPGHPVLIPWPLAAEVAKLPDEMGVAELFRRHAVRTIACSFAPATADLDTPEDFRRLQDRYDR